VPSLMQKALVRSSIPLQDKVWKHWPFAWVANAVCFRAKEELGNSCFL